MESKLSEIGQIGIAVSDESVALAFAPATDLVLETS